MKFLVDREVLEAVADYLSTKPYREVASLIAALQRSQPLEPDGKKQGNAGD